MIRTITFLLLFLSISLMGQKKWGLEECINYALTNNIQIKQQELNTKISKNQVLQSKLALVPSLNASLSRNFSHGRRVDSYTNEFTTQNTISDNYGLNSSVTLFNGFQKLNTIKKSQLDLQAALSDLDKLKNDISLNIASAYLNVLFNMELLETSNKQLKITLQQEDRIKKLVDAGSSAKGDLLDIQAQKANEELQKVNNENQLAISLLNLKQFLELDTVKDFNIVRPNVSIENMNIPSTPKDIFDYAIANLPQIMSAEYRLKASERSLLIAKGMRSPNLTLGLGYSSGYSDARQEIDQMSMQAQANGGWAQDASGNKLPTYVLYPNYTYKTKSFNDQLKDNASSYLMLSLNIPIFNAWQANTNISNSKINVLNVRYSLDLTKKNLYKEIEQKYLDAIAAKKKYLATKSSLQAAQEAFVYAEKKYTVGLINSLDYNQSKNKVTKAQSDLLQAKYQYVFAVKILDFYQGKTIIL